MSNIIRLEDVEQASAPLARLVAKAGEPLMRGDSFFRELVDALPAAVYTTDADGRITYFNEAAATLWGCRPELGKSEWCGSWRLFWPDGRLLPHDQCPMAIALKEKRPVRGMDAIAERPDGTRVPFLPYPTPIYDAAGTLIGAVNMLIDMTEWKRAEGTLQHFAAIVESSDDAIISKDLNGIITSWNKGAERIFGYLAEEMIGKSIKILIPADLQSEENTIIERIRSRPAHRALRDRAPAQIWRPGRYLADRLADQECARHDRRRLQDRPRHHRAQTRRSADCHARRAKPSTASRTCWRRCRRPFT